MLSISCPATKEDCVRFVPTISLMYDQVRQLKERRIPAIAIGSSDHGMDILPTCTGTVVVYLTAECVFGPSNQCRKATVNNEAAFT